MEYDVESCSAAGETNDGCTDSRRVNLTMPTGGSVIYGVGHQHTGGIGSTLYGEVLCKINNPVSCTRSYNLCQEVFDSVHVFLFVFIFCLIELGWTSYLLFNSNLWRRK